jgi:hypothetical protein
VEGSYPIFYEKFLVKKVTVMFYERTNEVHKIPYPKIFMTSAVMDVIHTAWMSAIAKYQIYFAENQFKKCRYQRK